MPGENAVWSSFVVCRNFRKQSILLTRQELQRLQNFVDPEDFADAQSFAIRKGGNHFRRTPVLEYMYFVRSPYDSLDVVADTSPRGDSDDDESSASSSSKKTRRKKKKTAAKR